MPAGRPRALDLDTAMPVIVRLFWGGEYSALTLDEVAEKLGVTKPTLYRTLGDKESILAAALEAYYQTYIQPCEEHYEHAATLREALEGAFAVAIDRILDERLPPGCFLGDTANSPYTSASVAVTISALQQQMFSLLSQRVATAIDDGELNPTAEPTVIVGFVLGQFSALSAVSRSTPSRHDLEAMVGFMLGGLPWGANRTLASHK